MKVGSSCKGCDHCEYEILDDYGCYDPGYYCDLKECPYNEEENPVRDVTCEECDYRLARETDPGALAICKLCANYVGGIE